MNNRPSYRKGSSNTIVAASLVTKPVT
uniref:Uncharacterized protein n=1 Tax=Arundo donax TaxID=35708 RepID=A0A0A9BRX0_ARUDO